MNYKYTFFDNQLVGVDHLNEITKRLVSGGISAVYSGVDFNVFDINDSNKEILTGGVVPESDTNMKVVSLGQGKYLINQGLCFFDDGTSMEILSGGEEISVPLGASGYVYLVSDKNQMKCYVEIASAPKQTGVFQLLAFIDSAGNITDKRTYARGKVPGFYASNEGREVNITEEYAPGTIKGSKVLEISVGEGNFRHLCIKVKGMFHNGSGYPIDYGGLFYCDFENGVAVSPAWSSSLYGASYLFYGSSGVGNVDPDNIKLKDGKLILGLTGCRFDYAVTFEYHLW